MASPATIVNSHPHTDATARAHARPRLVRPRLRTWAHAHMAHSSGTPSGKTNPKVKGNRTMPTIRPASAAPASPSAAIENGTATAHDPASTTNPKASASSSRRLRTAPSQSANAAGNALPNNSNTPPPARSHCNDSEYAA